MCVYRKESGFTLVELAIALMVIGLLIGGVLKGQELIDNARVTRTIKDVSDYNTATMIFYSSYGALPGDIKNPSRIPNCTDEDCLVAGDQNRQVGMVITSGVTALVNEGGFRKESRQFWRHLAKSGMISSISAAYTGTPNEKGTDFPKTPYETFLLLNYFEVNSAEKADEFPFNDQAGHYFIITNYLGGFGGNEPAITEKTAAQIDNKIDDGLPLSGTVRVSMRGGARCGGDDTTTYDMTPSRHCITAILANF